MEYIKNGTAFVKQAIEFDEQGNMSEALSSYLKALSWFEMEIKHGKNPCVKTEIRSKMFNYMERAEYLKQCLNKQRITQKEEVGETDGDKSEFEQAIESTVITDINPVYWKDVAGLEEAKKSLKEAVILPIQAPHLFSDGTQTWKGILLYGPPGTGKSYVARAVATEAKATFFSLSASNLISKFLGDSEKLVQTLFETAREHAPSIIFIDEIESILKSRSHSNTHQSMARVVGEFLAQLDGVGNSQDGVVVLGATNLPWTLDSAALRAGRFDRKIYIPLPDDNARSDLFRIHSKGSLNQNETQHLVEMTKGCSGSDVAGIVKAAAMKPLRKLQESTYFRLQNGRAYPTDPNHPDAVAMTWEDFDDKSILEKPPVEFQDYVNAALNTKPTTDENMLKKYNEWTIQFGLK
jgi:vacuolar protein-sorting-associated protein 4